MDLITCDEFPSTLGKIILVGDELWSTIRLHNIWSRRATEETTQNINHMKSSGHSSHIGQICDQSMRNLIITKKYHPPSLHSHLSVLEMVERDMA